jgi:hypothetical protein
MCLKNCCGGLFEFEEDKKLGYIAPEISPEEYHRRITVVSKRTDVERPEIQHDKYGLIWNDNKILVNLFKCAYIAMRVEQFRAGRRTPSEIDWA